MTNETNSAAVNALDGLAQAMLASVQPLIDARIEQEIEAQKAKIGVRKIEISFNGKESKVDGLVHRAFDSVLKIISAGLNPLLVGPAGCGKTKLCSDVAKAIDKDFASISCSIGMSESELTGWLLPSGEGGRFEYLASPFINMYEMGGAFLIDEMDAADASVLVTLNQALANGGFFCAKRGIHGGDAFVRRDKDSVVFAAANTYGNGAGHAYVGRNQLDATTLDRFVIIDVDYDRDLESNLGSGQVCDYIWTLRDKAKASGLRRVVGTRAIQKMDSLVAAGFSFRESKDFILSGWTKDELSKVGEAA